MATYAIGDLQGCYQELLALLDEINFDKVQDRLWFTGDLVNRGPESLQALRFVKQLGPSAVTVLGNHDLHLLAIAAGHAKVRKKDTLNDILEAPDRDELLAWLRRQPLLINDDDSEFVLIHAGLPPQWSIQQASTYAKEAEKILRGDDYHLFLQQMYGNKPDRWSEDLTGFDRIRFIVNSLTRLRYCDDAGQMALEEKGPPGTQAAPFKPWFTIENRKPVNNKIIFGHWSTVHLGNIDNIKSLNVFPMDTGCVWGDKLLALRLEDQKYFSVPSLQKSKIKK
jgi:bis(5'-nucleosyl)-tetraphosphatase (symmetrical)